jgi:hypothetical protein
VLKFILKLILGDTMKIKFFAPVGLEDGKKIVQIQIDDSKKHVYFMERNNIKWAMINVLKGTDEQKAVVLLAEYRGKYYWCNSINFKIMFQTFPSLLNEKEKFMKNGFQRKILEAVFHTPVMNTLINSMTTMKLHEYVQSEFMDTEE